MSHVVAIVGASGQIGSRVGKELLAAGHKVTALTRSVSDRNREVLEELKAAGATIEEVGSFDDEAAVAKALEKNCCDTMVITIQATSSTLEETETHLLAAAKSAGCVKRFVPDEWGANTMCLEGGEGPLFDVKRKMQQKVRDSGLDWTIVFTGGMFHYFLPTLKYGTPIHQFGDLDAKCAVHHIDDFGRVIAKAVVDERTVNKAVQMHANLVTQREALAKVQGLWPNEEFPTDHVPTDEIIRLRDEAMRNPTKITASFGAEPDADRWGINYVIYGIGKMQSLDHPDVVSANQLFPDLKYVTVEETLKDKSFVFP